MGPSLSSLSPPPSLRPLAVGRVVAFARRIPTCIGRRGVLVMRASFSLRVRRAGERVMPDREAIKREGRGAGAIRRQSRLDEEAHNQCQKIIEKEKLLAELEATLTTRRQLARRCEEEVRRFRGTQTGG